MSLQPDAILQLGGVQSTDILQLIPAAGRHVRISGASIGSLWADTRDTGALDSDYSQFRLTRATVPKWRMGNNLAGDGADAFFIRRDDDGDVSEEDALTIDRTSLAAYFAGDVYSNGVLLSGGGGGGGGSGVSVFGTLTTDTTGPAAYQSMSVSAASALFGTTSALMRLAMAETGIIQFSNTDHSNAQHGAAAHFGIIGLNGDGGVRLQQNLMYGSSIKLFEPGRPRGVVGLDSVGAFSYSWDPAAIAGVDGDYRVGGDRSNNPYVPQAGQSLVIYGAGASEPPGSVDYGHVDIFTMRAGQTLRLGTSNALNTPYHALEITAHVGGGAGNVNIRRTIVLGTAGTAGIAPLKFQTRITIAGAPGEGFMWWDGTNLKFDTGAGVVNIV